MMDGLNGVVEVANAVNTVGKLIDNGGKSAGNRTQPPEQPGSTDIFLHRSGGSISPAKVHFRAAIEHMNEVAHLEERIGYHASLAESRGLRLSESLRRVVYYATSGKTPKLLNCEIQPPVRPLDELVADEKKNIALMHKETGFAIKYAQGIVGELREYHRELMHEADSAKASISLNSGGLEKLEELLSQKMEALEDAQRDSNDYIPLMMEIQDLERKGRDFYYERELNSLKLVLALQLSGPVMAKEATVAAVLHEMTLMREYTGGFITYASRTNDADELVPMMVEASEAVAKSYAVLTNLVMREESKATGSVETLVETLGGVNYKIMPNLQREVRKQMELIGKFEKKTDYYDQAAKWIGASSKGSPAGLPAARPPSESREGSDVV